MARKRKYTIEIGKVPLHSEFKKKRKLNQPKKIGESKYLGKDGFFCAKLPRSSSSFMEGKSLPDTTTTSSDESQRSVLEQVNLLPPETALSKYIESHVNALAPPGTEHVYVRVMSNMSKVYTLKSIIKDFLEQYGISSELPYMSRVLMCFQATSNGLVAFFGVYMQEYEDKCAFPNKNTVYISMIDSVHLYEPRRLRRSVFNTVLICYFNYLSNSGFSNVYLWCCPPTAGVEYIFNSRPKSQQTPTIDRLRDWYKCLMEISQDVGVLENFANLVDRCPEQLDEFFRSFPYFCEDYWPDELERAIRAYEDEKSGLGRKKLTKTRKNSRKNVKGQLDLPEKHEYVFQKMILALRNLKDNFFCMKLNSPGLTASFKMEMIDSVNPSVFTNSRDHVVSFFTENNLEFENIDKAVSSTAAFLTEVYEECFYVFCSVCTLCVIEGFSCQTCHFDVCKSCMKRKFHHEHDLPKRIKCRDVGNPKVFFRDYDKLADETVAWKCARGTWWEDWKNAIYSKTENSNSALKVLCHVQTCKKNRCGACMQFRNLCYFAIVNLKLDTMQKSPTFPTQPEKKSKVRKVSTSPPINVESGQKVDKRASLKSSKGNGGRGWKQLNERRISSVKKIYNILETERIEGINNDQSQELMITENQLITNKSPVSVNNDPIAPADSPQSPVNGPSPGIQGFRQRFLDQESRLQEPIAYSCHGVDTPPIVSSQHLLPNISPPAKFLWDRFFSEEALTIPGSSTYNLDFIKRQPKTLPNVHTPLPARNLTSPQFCNFKLISNLPKLKFVWQDCGITTATGSSSVPLTTGNSTSSAPASYPTHLTTGTSIACNPASSHHQFATGTSTPTTHSAGSLPQTIDNSSNSSVAAPSSQDTSSPNTFDVERFLWCNYMTPTNATTELR